MKIEMLKVLDSMVGRNFAATGVEFRDILRQVGILVSGNMSYSSVKRFGVVSEVGGYNIPATMNIDGVLFDILITRIDRERRSAHTFYVIRRHDTKLEIFANIISDFKKQGVSTETLKNIIDL